MARDPMVKPPFIDSRRAYYATLRPRDKYVGSVGVGLELRLRVKAAKTREGSDRHFILATDPDRRVVVYWGPVWLGPQGRTVRVRATVREHRFYKGSAQTVIEDPVVLDG